MQIQPAPSNIISVDFRISSTGQDEIALMRLVAEGDKEAMHALFSRHNVQVYRFLVRLTKHRATAEDLVHDVFIEAWRHARQFQARSKVSTWLLAIARNLACSAMRRRVFEERNANLMGEVWDYPDDPETATRSSQQDTALACCLTQLSPLHREVIDLVYYHERSISEASEIIGIPKNTVKTRMYYARKEIRTALQKFCIGHSFTQRVN